MNIRASLMDGLGGLLHEQTRTIDSGDVLIVITFPSYAEEVMSITREVAERGGKIIVITDRLTSQAVSVSDVHFFTDKITVGGFRTLSGTMCLAQVLTIGLGMSDGRLIRDTIHSDEDKQII